MKVTHNPTPNPYTVDTSVEKNVDKASKNKNILTDQTQKSSTQGATVEISDNARLMREATQIAKSAPDIRNEKISALKKSILEGKYHVDAKEIADRLVDEHLSSDFGKNSL